jgi:predicted dehydrogenase
MTTQGDLSRRKFVVGAGVGGAAGIASPLVVAGAALGADNQSPPSQQIRVGLIGCGGMGLGNLANCARHADVVVAAVCDVWQQRREAALTKYQATAKAYADYRELLAQKDVDAVIIASPPHWHCRQAVDACEAGKDLYLQKPMTLHLGESLAVRNAVQKHQRISQVGTQIHASENYRRVVELVRSGNLGAISVVRTFNVQNQGPEGVGRDPTAVPPPGLDWQSWIGPYPLRPYNAILARSSFHHCSFFTYSGGWTPGMAPHIIDLPVWALELGYPTSVSCSGGRYVIRDDGDAPDVQEILWQYPQLTMTWMGSMVNSYGFDLHGEPKPQRRLGIYFHGSNGTLWCNYGMHKVVPEGDRMQGLEPPKPSLPPSPGHEREWLDCIKTRQQPSCSVFYHLKVDVPLVLGNLAYALGRSLRFDPVTEKIVGDDEAARRAVPEYRAPWKFPAEYLR